MGVETAGRKQRRGRGGAAASGEDGSGVRGLYAIQQSHTGSQSRSMSSTATHAHANRWQQSTLILPHVPVLCVCMREAPHAEKRSVTGMGGYVGGRRAADEKIYRVKAGVSCVTVAEDVAFSPRQLSISARRVFALKVILLVRSTNLPL